jgi:hemerythrin
MAFLEWDPGFSVKIAEIDQQHKNLIGFINRLYEAMKPSSSQDALEAAIQELSTQATIINEMVEYSSYHFSTEEKYMLQYRYPDYEKHKKEHEYFINKVRILKSDFDDGKVILSSQITQFLKEWLSTHILGTDKKYGPFFQSKGLK